MNTINNSDVSDVSDACFEINACSKGLLPVEVIEGGYTYNVGSRVTHVTHVTRVTGLRARLKALNVADSARPKTSAVEHVRDSEIAAPAPLVDVARTHKAEIVAEIQGQAAPSPALAEIDRFFSSASPHMFEDGTTGWIDLAHKAPSVELVHCPVIGEPSPRASCVAFNGCPDIETCKAFKRSFVGRK